MSGDWIKMRGNLWDDPRVGRICDLTGSKEAAAVGALYWLWSAADQHTENGCMPGLSLQQIDRKTGVKGFGAALVDVGWLRDAPDGVVIENFEEHNGASAKKRAQTAKRVGSHRSGNASKTTNDEIGNAVSVTPALAREEKRREEEKETPPTTSGPPAEAVDDSPVLKASSLVAEGVEPGVAADWMKIRRAKKAPLTMTAWEAVKREAAAAGLTPAQAVRHATESGWQGFRAVWLVDKPKGVNGTHVDRYAGSAI